MTRPTWSEAAKSGERLAKDLASAQELLEGVEIVDLGELYEADLPELHYMLYPMFPEGLILFAGKPKLGKSTLIRQLLWKANIGGEMFGSPVHQTKCMFISMEENKRQTRIKMRQMGGGAAAMFGINSAFEWKKGKDGIVQIRAYLELNPECRMIAIDSLSAFREPVNSREPQFQQDYRSLEMLKAICNDFQGMTIIVLHHAIKGEVEDPMDAIAGSNGLAAVADMLLVLMGTNDGRFRLNCRGRNWEYHTNDLELGREDWQWVLLNDWDGVSFKDNSREREIFNFIKDNGHVTASTLIHRAGIPKTCVYDGLAKLFRDGLIKKEANAYYL